MRPSPSRETTNAFLADFVTRQNRAAALALPAKPRPNVQRFATWLEWLVIGTCGLIVALLAMGLGASLAIVAKRVGLI